MRRIGLQQMPAPKPKYIPKPYEQMLYPGQRVQIDVKYVPSTCLVGDAKGKRFYQYTAIDEFSRLRYIEAFEEHNTYSSAVFLEHAVRFFKFPIRCIQTDNGLEFTNRFASTKYDLPNLFECKVAALGIRHKLIRPYTPRHNGKVERSHREDQKRFYSKRTFYSFADFKLQLEVYRYRSNKIPCARSVGYRQPNILHHMVSKLFDKPTFRLKLVKRNCLQTKEHVLLCFLNLNRIRCSATFPTLYYVYGDTKHGGKNG
jgi:transposase InsO family protein